MKVDFKVDYRRILVTERVSERAIVGDNKTVLSRDAMGNATVTTLAPVPKPRVCLPSSSRDSYHARYS